MGTLNFTEPNPYTLSQIDSYIQSKGGPLERSWDRNPGSTLYMGEGDGWGWEKIAEVRPHDMTTAYYSALAFMSTNGITHQDIIKFSTF